MKWKSGKLGHKMGELNTRQLQKDGKEMGNSGTQSERGANTDAPLTTIPN